MSETRSSSALFKRAEQLKRWEDSETNRQPSEMGNKPKKIKFSSGCVFLAACASSDKEEVLNLLKTGADINTANVDGLTALHQACIDNNLDMVEFLVENQADVNRGDNEGWTPLHATASCGFLSIAKYLIDHGANVAACNNDGELAIDIAESDDMEDLLQRHIELQGINPEDARTFEERSMLEDAKYWLASGCLGDVPNPKTGASALHVAAAKGYIKVMNILIQAGSDLNCQDYDGWTALHAAAHWAQREACQILVEHFCDMNIKNYVGQTCFDIADLELVSFLEDLRKKQASMERSQQDINSVANKQQQLRNNILPKRRLSSDRSAYSKAGGGDPPTSPTQESKGEDDVTLSNNKMAKVETRDRSKMDTGVTSDQDVKNRLNREDTNAKISQNNNNSSSTSPVINSTPVPPSNNNTVTSPSPKAEDEIFWKPASGLRRKTADTKNNTINTSKEQEPSDPVIKNEATPPDVALRRTRSFEADEKFKRRYLELRAKINAGNSCPSLLVNPLVSSVPSLSPTNSNTPTRTASLKERPLWRRGVSKEEPRVSINTSSNNVAPSSPPSSTTTSPQHSLTSSVRRSFVPPVRDEESETQRKAHAKRVRETRRSTQGVTLEELKSAEQLVKKKQQQQLAQVSQQFMLEDARDTNSTNNSDKSRTSSRGATDTAETTVTIPLRRPAKLAVDSDKEQDKENDSRNAQATQAVIQRRKRPKRRSTGVVHVDLDEILDRAGEGDDVNHTQSGGDNLDSRSRLNSESSSRKLENGGDLDYKKLYEESQAELARMRDTLSKTEEELNQVKATYSKNSLTEQEKRERRTMERKLSEMEVELKELDQYKKENQRLKDENGALIRVISKLSK